MPEGVIREGTILARRSCLSHFRGSGRGDENGDPELAVLETW
jgi:hypothetical protein